MKRYASAVVVAVAVGVVLKAGLAERLLCNRGYHFVWSAGNKHGLYMRCLICTTELELRRDGVDGADGDD